MDYKEDTFILFVYNIHLGGSTVLQFYAERDSNISRLRVNFQNYGITNMDMTCMHEYSNTRFDFGTSFKKVSYISIALVFHLCQFCFKLWLEYSVLFPTTVNLRTHSILWLRTIIPINT